MTRYWVIAPYEYEIHQPQKWEAVWQYDLSNNVISLGWGELGNISKYDQDQLKTAVSESFPDRGKGTKTSWTNILWDFYNTVSPGDMVMARKGTKQIAAIGTVTSFAYFSRNKNPNASDPTDPHFSYIDVQWHSSPRDRIFRRIVFGRQALYEIAEDKFRNLLEEPAGETALYLNGVYKSVLDEIINAQQENPGLVYYLQPYSSAKIKLLAETTPTKDSPLQLYISKSEDLAHVLYRAKIVGWEDKQTLTPSRLNDLNAHIQEHQPSETNIYQTLNDGKRCANLIAIIDLEQLPHPFPVTNLIKTTDGERRKARSQPGGYSYVYEVPDWMGTIQPLGQLDAEFSGEVKDAQKLTVEERRKRLENASKIPEKVSVTSFAYRRNPDVVVEVLRRANGKCEACQADAPFRRKSDGNPYLEVHHCRPLADGGEDTVENAIAVCPNCHRRFHYGDGEYKIENGRCVAC